MKKLILLLIIWLSWLQCHAPESKIIPVPKGEIFYLWTSCPIERAFIRLESNFKTDVVNSVSGAIGVLQITTVMIADVNKICKRIGLKRHYKIQDAFSPEKSLEIFRIAIIWYDPADLQEACKIWFGRGKQHDGWTWKEYHKKLVGYLN